MQKKKIFFQQIFSQLVQRFGWKNSQCFLAINVFALKLLKWAAKKPNVHV